AGVARRASQQGWSTGLSRATARRADSCGASRSFMCSSRALRRKADAARHLEIYI
ncbi:hypothetical protein A2U01_0087975, partial [Trifolium medium]|nr:hypothetical protein [Trifolium medium]